jgi:predicted RNase H-like nuclease
VSGPLAVGVDGARGGWAVACLYEAGTRLLFVRDIAEIARLRGDAPVAIDMPIGLLDSMDFRPCDTAARRLLGHRSSTVFAPPARHLLAAAGDYAGMRALIATERRTNHAAKSLSAQSAGIASKVREVDEYVRANRESERWLFECHPELCFLVLSDEAPLDRKRSPAGARQRLRLVQAAFADAEARIAAAPGPATQADWLDAYAALITARAIVFGEHATLGGERDAAGVRMRMVLPAESPSRRHRHRLRTRPRAPAAP